MTQQEFFKVNFKNVDINENMVSIELNKTPGFGEVTREMKEIAEKVVEFDQEIAETGRLGHAYDEGDYGYYTFTI